MPSWWASVGPRSTPDAEGAAAAAAAREGDADAKKDAAAAPSARLTLVAEPSSPLPPLVARPLTREGLLRLPPSDAPNSAPSPAPSAPMALSRALARSASSSGEISSRSGVGTAQQRKPSLVVKSLPLLLLCPPSPSAPPPPSLPAPPD